MSIAVSVIVRPSSGLRLLHAGLCCCVMASSAACPGTAAPLLCLLAGLLGGWLGWSPRITCQLDVSGVGQLRLTVYQQGGAAQGAGAALRLLDGSTLWPGLMLLRLGGDDGDQRAKVTVLVLLPDSATRAELRALSLACRAIAAHAEIKTPTL